MDLYNLSVLLAAVLELSLKALLSTPSLSDYIVESTMKRFEFISSLELVLFQVGTLHFQLEKSLGFW